MTFASPIFKRAPTKPWTVVGEAFGRGLDQGTIAGQMRLEGYRGKGSANSFQWRQLHRLTDLAGIFQRTHVYHLPDR